MTAKFAVKWVYLELELAPQRRRDGHLQQWQIRLKVPRNLILREPGCLLRIAHNTTSGELPELLRLLRGQPGYSIDLMELSRQKVARRRQAGGINRIGSEGKHGSVRPGRLTDIGDPHHVVHQSYAAGLEQCFRAVVAELLRDRRGFLEVVRLNDDFVEQDQFPDEIAKVDRRWALRIASGFAGDRPEESVARLHTSSMKGERRTRPMTTRLIDLR